MIQNSFNLNEVLTNIYIVEIQILFVYEFTKSYNSV